MVVAGTVTYHQPKSGYWEIADTVWHNTPYSQTDNDKLIKREKWRKSHCSNHSVKSVTYHQPLRKQTIVKFGHYILGQCRLLPHRIHPLKMANL
jgi:hypothetical protein